MVYIQTPKNIKLKIKFKKKFYVDFIRKKKNTKKLKKQKNKCKKMTCNDTADNKTIKMMIFC